MLLELLLCLQFGIVEFQYSFILIILSLQFLSRELKWNPAFRDEAVQLL